MKSLKILTLHVMKYLGLFTLVRYFTRHGVRILCYHGVWLGDEGFCGDAIFMRPESFHRRLELLRRWRFPVMSLNQAVAGFLDGEILPSCPVVITIDDGWYSTYASMLPALMRLEMPATIYCDTAHLLSRKPVPHVMVNYLRNLVKSGFVGNPERLEAGADDFQIAIRNSGDTSERLAAVRRFAECVCIDFDHYVDLKVFDYMSPEQLHESCEAGIDVQLHTHTHSMHDFDAIRLEDELEENRFHLEQILHRDTNSFRHFCYPSGRYAPHVESVLRERGIASATTTEQAIAHRGTNPYFLPRILDGEHLAPIEFEAELCGIMDIIRSMKRLLRV